MCHSNVRGTDARSCIRPRLLRDRELVPNLRKLGHERCEQLGHVVCLLPQANPQQQAGQQGPRIEAQDVSADQLESRRARDGLHCGLHCRTLQHSQAALHQLDSTRCPYAQTGHLPLQLLEVCSWQCCTAQPIQLHP